MPPQKLLDSHVHLWPPSATTSTAHAWMTPATHPLARRHSIAEYRACTSSPPPAFVYIETDRSLPSPTPPLPAPLPAPGSTAAWAALERELETWAAQPVAELRFLRRVVAGAPDERADEGFAPADSALLAGVVAWAPLRVPAAVFRLYLRLAERIVGREAWGRVVGFRCLLQGMREEGEMRGVALGEAWVGNLVGLGSGRGGRGWAFDVGVDSRSGGVWQVEVAAEMVERVRVDGGRTVFVVSGLPFFFLFFPCSHSLFFSFLPLSLSLSFSFALVLCCRCCYLMWLDAGVYRLTE